MIQRGKEFFAICPCGRESLVLAFVDGGAFCPACAPTPDKTPHDYRFVGLPPKNGKALATANLVSGVCCGDSGDCAHECGIA